MLYIDMPDDIPAPKRGDILQTNLGDKRERTWLILRATRRRCKRRSFNVWAARWWELEPDFRLRLYASAERHGGQRVVHFHRYPPKPRPPWKVRNRRPRAGQSTDRRAGRAG